jgi:arylsulfatase A-like enzyme
MRPLNTDPSAVGAPLRARLAGAVAAALGAALVVTAFEVVSLLAVSDLPRLTTPVVLRFGAAAWATTFLGALVPGALLAAALARPYGWAAGVLRRADRRRQRLAALGAGGACSLVVGALFLVTLKKASADNLVVVAGVMAVLAVAVSALTPIVARHLTAAVEGRPAPLAGRVLCVLGLAVCYAAGRFTLRGDYTTLHQLYALGALSCAALLALGPAVRLARRPRALGAVAALGLAGVGLGLYAPAGSQLTRHALFNRTGVVQYVLIGASMLRPPPAPAAPAPLPPPAAPVADPSRPRPNVIWVMIDTLRADKLGAYDPASTLTPHLDAFAKEAVVFRNAWSQATNTIPSMSSFLTGRHVALRAPDPWHRAADAPHAGPFFLPAPYRAYMVSPPYHDLVVRDVLAPGAITVLPADKGDADDAGTIERTLGLLRDQRPPSPFFLLITQEGPHAHGADSRRAAYVPYPVLRDEYTRAYDAAVKRADANFGRLVEGLKAQGLYDDSIIVVLADHGEELGDHGDLFHAKEVYATSHHVPLLIRLPGGAHAGPRDALAELADLVPTMGELVGLAPVAGHPLSGESLVPWIEGSPPPAAREAWTEAVFMRRKVMALVEQAPDGHLTEAIHDASDDVTEVYDLSADPREAHDLADADPQRTSALRARIRARLAAEADPRFLPLIQP